jgi:hypothetical protein
MQRCWRVAQHDGRGAAEEDASLLGYLAEEVLDCLVYQARPGGVRPSVQAGSGHP